MDYFSHGIWSYLIFHNRKKVLLAVLFGLMPDTLSFFPYLLYRVFIGSMEFGPPDVMQIPPWVDLLYGISHSLIVCVCVFLVVLAFLRRIPFYMWTWPIAIGIDVLTHTRDFLPTPFLWPVSEWRFPGISWGEWWFMITNYSVMLIVLIFVYRKTKNKKKF